MRMGPQGPKEANRMRKVGVIAAMALGAMAILAIPSSAFAVSDCSYASGTTVGPVTVYGPGGGRTANSVAGVCADTNTQPLDGGYVEVGSGGPGSYAIVDGSDANSDPTGNGDGYIGASTYESATRDSSCANGPDQGTAG